MIEPTATAIAYLLGDDDVTALVGLNIAAQHRYGSTSVAEPWLTGDPGIALVPLAGQTPERVYMLEQRYEARCYGDRPDLALVVARALLAICEDFAAGDRVRVPVNLPSGERALLYWLLADDSGQLDVDPDLRNTAGDRMDMVRVPIKVAISNTAV